MIFLLLLDVTAFLEITTLVFLINTAGILNYSEIIGGSETDCYQNGF